MNQETPDAPQIAPPNIVDQAVTYDQLLQADVHPALRPHIERLAAEQATQNDQPKAEVTTEAVLETFAIDKLAQTSGETSTSVPRMETSPQHHAEHLSVTAFIPGIESLPTTQIDEIGEIVEVGISSLAESIPKPTAIRSESKELPTQYPSSVPEKLRRLKNLRQEDSPDDLFAELALPDGTYDNETVQAVCKKYIELGVFSIVSSYAITRAIGNQPALARAIATYGSKESTSDWHKLAAHECLADAADSRRHQSEARTSFFMNPFEEEGAPVDDATAAKIAENIAVADQLVVLADRVPVPQTDGMRAYGLIKKFGALEKDGISVSDAVRYDKLTSRDWQNTNPTSEQIKVLLEDFDSATPAIQNMMQNDSRYDLQKLAALGNYVQKLYPEDSDVPVEEQLYKLSILANIAGCQENASVEQAALGRKVIDELIGHGVPIEGVLALIGRKESLAYFQEAADRDTPETYELSLELMARLLNHPALVENFQMNRADSGVHETSVLQNLLTRPQTYEAAIAVIDGEFDKAIAAGYPPEKATTRVLYIFSQYAGNLSYPGNVAESYSDRLKLHSSSNLTAMQIIGDSSIELDEAFDYAHGRALGALSYQIAQGHMPTTTTEQIQAGYRRLGSSLHRLKDTYPGMLKVVERVSRDMSMGMDPESVEEWLSISESVSHLNKELAEKLIGWGEFGALQENIELFTDLDTNIALSLIDNYHGEMVLDNAERFAGLELNAALADRLMDHGLYIAVLSNSERFNGLDRLHVADRMIAGGRAETILARLSEFDGIVGLQSENLRTQRFVELVGNVEAMALFSNNGPLEMLKNQFLNLYLDSQNPQAVLSRMKSLASGDNSLWHINHEYAKLLVGEVGNVGYLKDYLVEKIPLALPRADISAQLEGMPEPVPFEHMDAESRRLILSERCIQAHPDLMSLESISFTDLNTDAQDSLLAYRLFESIAKTRDIDAQQQASERNKDLAANGDYWQMGDLIHATNTSRNFMQILQSGVLCGETLGAASSSDSYPFNVDTVTVSAAVMAQPDHESRVAALSNSSYGSIALLFKRSIDSTDYGRETKGGMNQDHRLVFGAIPGTEISAVLLRSATEIMTNQVIDTVIEAGIYIPILGNTGDLLLSYEDFQKRRADGNYIAAKPRMVDTSFKREGTQSGSNEGALFVVPEAGGVAHYYVKFGDTSPQKRDHIWSEVLTDRLYRTIVPELVPNTEVIMVEGRLAKASKIVELIEGALVTNEARNEGFIADCFLGNWDAVYNPRNLIMSASGHAMRVDTGNGLDFRPRGDKKDPGTFGDSVIEVEEGTKDQDLSGGMRQMYPGLSDAQIRSQVRELRDRLPDEMIDTLVETIRRPKQERLELARVLKARKHYLIGKFL